jgi:hypothetical protein
MWPFAITIAVVVAASPACSAVSGWADLQGGKRPAETGSGPITDGGSDDDPPADATSERAVIPGTGLVCGNTRCAKDLGCCVVGTAQSCTDDLACEDMGGVYLRCRNRADCASTGLDCCLASSAPFDSECTTACSAQSKAVLCDPAETQPCRQGTCNGKLGNLDLMYCN